MALSSDLVAFVKASLERRIARAEIAAALSRAGWPPEQTAAALDAFADVEFPIPVPRPVPHVSARDAFLYLVMFGALFLSIYNLGVLVFELIDRSFPDPVSVDRLSLRESIRWAVSTLVVTVPLFLYLVWLTARAVRIDPTKRASHVRRQLTYLTLFVAGCCVLGDVITLVYNFLGGELTVRFLLKAATVAALAGGVFAYYLTELRRDESAPET